MTNQDESTPINDLRQLVNSFTFDQLRYIAVRPFVKWDKEAAQAIGLAPETVSRWENKTDVDEAVRLMAMDGVIVASEMFRRYLPQAAREIIDELGDQSVSMRHKAAKEVLDRGGMPVMQQHEFRGKFEGAIEHGIDGDAAETIFDILASIGAIQTTVGDAKDDEIHTTQAD